MSRGRDALNLVGRYELLADVAGKTVAEVTGRPRLGEV